MLALILACAPAADPYAALDLRYAEILSSLNIAERDCARDIHNEEARRRRLRHEQERRDFFNDPSVVKLIEEARKSSDPAIHERGEAFWRHAILVRAWTAEEKEKEADLLAKIEGARNREAGWSAADGVNTISLVGRWDAVSEAADTLTPEQREDLAAAWLDQRLAWIGSDLDALVNLRNEVARREGYSSWWELSLAHRGLDKDRVHAMSSEIEAIVTPLNQAAAARVAETAAAKGVKASFAQDPWLRRQAGLAPDVGAEGWFDGDRAEERLTELFSVMGLANEGLQIYVGSSRNTRSGAYSFPIHPPEHAAVVLSNDTRWSDWPYRGLAHEMGLAAWWKSLPAEAAARPTSWEPPAPFFEGFGDLFERMIYEPAFLEKYVPDLPADKRAAMSAARVSATAETLTWYLLCTRAEEQLYARPGQVPAIAAEMAIAEKQLRGWTFEVPVSSGGMPWTSALQSQLMLNYPGYVQNFLYSAVTEAVLWQAATAAVGDPVGNPKLGPWLKEQVVDPVSKGEPFDKRLETLAGGPPAAALKKYLGG